VNGRKYYVLESTAKGSSVGFLMDYDVKEIDIIVEPFENEKLEINSLEFKL
jgi:NAD kinase